MFIVGRTEEGSSSVPTRTAVTCGLADEFANRGDPHLGQKRCVISLPLSAVLANSLNCPEISIAAVGRSTFTMPLADMCWQSRHQQTLVASGSAERRKRTAPQRQCPVLSVTWSSPLNCFTRGSARPSAGAASQLQRNDRARADVFSGHEGTFDPSVRAVVSGREAAPCVQARRIIQNEK